MNSYLLTFVIEFEIIDKMRGCQAFLDFFATSFKNSILYEYAS